MVTRCHVLNLKRQHYMSERCLVDAGWSSGNWEVKFCVFGAIIAYRLTKQAHSQYRPSMLL